MNHSMLIKLLSQNGNTFKSLLSGLPEEMYLWKPAPDKWCLLEIVCHLFDEEREDFRARLKLALFTPSLPWVSIDPAGWVSERKYIEENYENKIASFLREREESVKWLESLSNPDWKSAHHHQKFGPLSAEFFLANWLAHDYLHFRQVTRTKYLYLQVKSGMPLDYAGTW